MVQVNQIFQCFREKATFTFFFSQRYATHVMASDMGSLLAPPSRSGALSRAHTDPTSSSNCSNYEHQLPQRTPNSPPPTYEEVMKQVFLNPYFERPNNSQKISQFPEEMHFLFRYLFKAKK